MIKDRMAARLYAAALYGYIEADFSAQLQALAALGCAITQVPEFREILAHPGFGRAERESLLESVFKQGVPDAARRFFRLLHKRGKLRLLPQIVDELEALYRRRNNIRRVEITTAFDLGSHEQWLIGERITAMLKQRVDTQFLKDGRLIAGVRIKMGDTVMENSLRNSLASLRRRFLDLREYTKENEPCR